MRPNIDFGECLKDSPRFRASLEEAEADLEQLETKLEKLVRLCSTMIDAGKTYANASGAFISGVKDVSTYFQEDSEVSKTLDKFAHGMSELQKYHNILLDQAHRSVCKNVNTFLKNDIKKVKETRKHFEKISDDMDNALAKNAQAPRSKGHECEDAHNVLTAMRSCFGHTSLDYVFQINILHSRKRFEVLETMLSYMHAQSTYFHQGYDLFEDHEPFMKQIANELETLSSKAVAEKKEMEERHLLVQQREQALNIAPLPSPPEANANHDIKMEGYLFKRTSNAFKSWVRRWFMIQDDQLVYRKRSKDSLTIMEDDLRLCTVKPAVDIDRRFCFEVLSPTRTHMLQADSEAECQAWISAIAAAVNKAYRDSASYQNNIQQQNQEQQSQSSEVTYNSQQCSGDTTGATRSVNRVPSGKKNYANSASVNSKVSRMTQMISLPGNRQCCDCGASEPRWASVNLGIVLCIECSGIHRSFGVHKSKVRSLTLDTWEPELVKVMLSLGNTVVNKIYEANVDESVAIRATPHCDRVQREAWIKAKYIQKAFVAKLPEKAVSDSPTKVRRWSVRKSKRKSPGRTDPDNMSEGGENLGLTPNILQGESKDSGLGGSTQDVIVFGAAVSAETQDVLREGLDDELSEDSISDHDADADTQSITSLEDVSRLDPNLLLYKAAYARNLPVMLEALAYGADPNWHNPKELGTTPLMKAVGSMTACEFMLLNGGKVDRKDNEGRTPLHHAVVHGMTGQVCQFLKRGANQHAVDVNGQDSLAIAVENANADIVTLLRLSKLNEEMKESEGFLGGNGDETFTEVFRDFTNMANNDPEKLNRNWDKATS